MNHMTPFAQLGKMHKSASDLFSTGNEWTDLGVDMAAGTNPFTGVPYYGAKMVDDFRQGNIASGLGNALWGGLSFVGGAALGKGALGLGAKLLGRGAAKGVAKTVAKPVAQQAVKPVGMVGNAAQKVQQGVQAYKGGINNTQDFVNRQMTGLGNRLATKTIPMTGGRQLGQRGGAIAANTGVLGGGIAAGSVLDAMGQPTTPPAQQPAQPTQPAAPDWYTATTGNTTVPQF
jgi:hypothetical protein